MKTTTTWFDGLVRPGIGQDVEGCPSEECQIRRQCSRASCVRPCVNRHDMTRLVLYLAAPLGAPDRAGLDANLQRAMRWLAWLRRSFPEVTFVASWIAAVLSGEDDSDPAQREAGLVDADAIVPRCDGIVLVGGRVSNGMARERGHTRRVWDLTGFGPEPPNAAPAPDDVAWRGWATAFEVVVARGGYGLAPHHWHGLTSATESAADLAPAANPSQDASNRRNGAGDQAAASAGTREVWDGPPGARWRIFVTDPPKPCARRIGSTWCTLADGHAGECSGPPGRDIAATEYGPGRLR